MQTYNRKIRLVHNIDLRVSKGIEFGPFANPIVLKKDSEVLYVDYFDEEKLIKKARNNPNLNPNDVVKLDYSLKNGPLLTLLSAHAPFDYVVSSHVFEHLPNPLGWLRDVSSLLKKGGIINMAIPDRRFTFDYFRKETTYNDLLSFDFENLTIPNEFQLIDHFTQVREVNTQLAWAEKPNISSCKRYHDEQQVLQMLQKVRTGQYLDCHCTVWTYDHFLAVLPLALEEKGIPLEIVFADIPVYGSNEFIVQLTKK